MNVTLSVPDELLSRARRIAQEQGMSLNAMIRRYLEELTGEGARASLADQLDELWQERTGHSGGWRFARAELYDRDAARPDQSST